ncbi:hypothetical protein LJB82_02855 [Desulfovibrio sp. OttesenSCG-928-M16]|nr:hypothetical protein [Desulfovibrio sp. OttesenSCG-928-M16]
MKKLTYVMMALCIMAANTTFAAEKRSTEDIYKSVSALAEKGNQETDQDKKLDAYAQLPNPLKNIRVGQWASYPVSWEGSEGMQKDTLVGIEGEGDGRILKTTREIIVGGKVVNSEERTFTYSEAVADMRSLFDEAGDTTISPVKLDVNGKELDCILVNFTDGSTKCKLYLSEEIPLTGIVRFEVEGLDKPVMAVAGYEK